MNACHFPKGLKILHKIKFIFTNSLNFNVYVHVLWWRYINVILKKNIKELQKYQYSPLIFVEYIHFLFLKIFACISKHFFKNNKKNYAFYIHFLTPLNSCSCDMFFDKNH